MDPGVLSTAFGDGRNAHEVGHVVAGRKARPIGAHSHQKPGGQRGAGAGQRIEQIVFWMSGKQFGYAPLVVVDILIEAGDLAAQGFGFERRGFDDSRILYQGDALSDKG